MQFLPLRLPPGVDLRGALAAALRQAGTDSAFVVCGIGSLTGARLRYAGEFVEATIAGPLEIVSLSGSLTRSGPHLHMSVSDASGRVCGGHVGLGNLVRTTAEILLALLPEGALDREHDATTGFSELVARRPV
jgi:uncharacterized protein